MLFDHFTSISRCPCCMAHIFTPRPLINQVSKQIETVLQGGPTRRACYNYIQCTQTWTSLGGKAKSDTVWIDTSRGCFCLCTRFNKQVQNSPLRCFNQIFSITKPDCNIFLGMVWLLSRFATRKRAQSQDLSTSKRQTGSTRTNFPPYTRLLVWKANTHTHTHTHTVGQANFILLSHSLHTQFMLASYT